MSLNQRPHWHTPFARAATPKIGHGVPRPVSRELYSQEGLRTPKFNYTYARQPTPLFVASARDGGGSSGGGSSGRRRKKSEREDKNKIKTGRRRRRQRRLPCTLRASSAVFPDPSKDDPAEFQTSCLQGVDPHHPNHVIWGARQRWLQAAGPSPGPATAMADVAGAGRRGVPSVVIGGARPKNDVEWSIYRASFIPGPSDYLLADKWTTGSGGGRFSNATPKEHLDWVAYYAGQLPAPGDYKLPEHHPKGGVLSTARPKSDVEWKVYRASFVPGPGQYNMDASTMARQGRMEKKGAVMQGKVVKGNSRTVVPHNFTMFKGVTTNPRGPTACRTDSSLGTQIASLQKSAPSFSFGSRTAAASIFGLPPPAVPKKRKYRRKKKSRAKSVLGYDPFEKQERERLEKQLHLSELENGPTAPASIASLRSGGSSVNTSAQLRASKSEGSLFLGQSGTTSKSFLEQYRRSHRLSRPKHEPKVPHLEHAHFAAMRRTDAGGAGAGW